MLTASFKFLPDLNLFLPAGHREGVFFCSFQSRQTVKHLIESAGLPHTEVGQIQANQQPVDFNYLVQDGDQITVKPYAPGQAVPPSGPSFVLDNHLGRLAAYLRMLGLDVIYRNNFADDELAQIASQQTRILLTRDRRLLMRKVVKYGYCLRSLDSRQQASEVVKRYQLFGKHVPFRRCLRCNALLEPVDKENIYDQLQPLTRLYYDDFLHCPGCGQVYWKGSHYERMLVIINHLNSGG